MMFGEALAARTSADEKCPIPKYILSSLSLHCTALYFMELYLRLLYFTLLHYTALYCTVFHCTALHCTAPFCTALHCTALHCTAYCPSLGRKIWAVVIHADPRVAAGRRSHGLHNPTIHNPTTQTSQWHKSPSYWEEFWPFLCVGIIGLDLRWLGCPMETSTADRSHNQPGIPRDWPSGCSPETLEWAWGKGHRQK